MEKIQFNREARVFSGNGETIGALNRVAIEPPTREVSGPVVGKEKEKNFCGEAILKFTVGMRGKRNAT